MRTLLLLLALPALARARFSVTAGGDDCAVTDGGDCVTSSGYSRGGYSENEGCTITMDPPAPLSVLDFDVEDYFDHLSIRGTDGPAKCEGGVSCWTGSNGPDGVTPAGAIVWTSDFFAPAKGFKICTTVPGGGPSSPAGPAADDDSCDSYFYNYGYLFGNVECGANKPPPPPAPPPPPPGFIVESGPCTTTKDGSCVRSDNFDTKDGSCVRSKKMVDGKIVDGPCEYGTYQECVIAPTQDLFLSATSFATEKNYDYLTIVDEKYIPSHLPPVVQNDDFLKIVDEKYTGTRQPAYRSDDGSPDWFPGARTLDADGEPAYLEVIPHKYLKLKPHQKIVWVSDVSVGNTGCALCATHARFQIPARSY